MGAIEKWNVVDGEQPSASKWNILGQNDASLNDGSAFHLLRGQPIRAKEFSGTERIMIGNDYWPSSSGNTGIKFNRLPYKNDTADIRRSYVMQAGWGYLPEPASGDAAGETVLFPESFDQIYYVKVSYNGRRTNAIPTDITDSNAGEINSAVVFKAKLVTNFGFQANMNITDASTTFNRGDYYIYSWIAFGEKN